MALEQETKVYQFLKGYGEMLLADISADQAYELICDGGLSPAWILGHLAWVANRVVALGGGVPKIDTDALKPLFGGGSQPKGAADQAAYPSWEQLINDWRAGHADVVAVVPTISTQVLGGPNPNERMRPALPTVHDFLSFVLTGHEAMHLGQLSTWRRVHGRPPLF